MRITGKKKQSVNDNTGQELQKWQGQKHLQQQGKKNYITKWVKKKHQRAQNKDNQQSQRQKIMCAKLNANQIKAPATKKTHSSRNSMVKIQH